jgi:hypothetical protein
MKKLVTSIIIGLALAACGGGSGGAGIVFSPSTESCLNPAPFTETLTLPSSVTPAQLLYFKFDGKLAMVPMNLTALSAFGGGSAQKPDGSWQFTIQQSTATEIQQACADPASNSSVSMGIGTHTTQVLDANNNVLAQGSYTVAN